MPNRASPFLSVIMSVYNGERFLREAIHSILAQTYTDFELIIVDDASTDSTPAILEASSDPRLVRLKNPQNLGLTRSLNKALAVARGELIARQDADDISVPDRFRQQVAFLDDHPEIGLLGTRYELIDQNRQVLEVVLVPTNDRELRDRLLHINPFCHGSVMMRRGYLEKAGGYREQFPVTQDYDLWLRLAEFCRLANLDSILYQFRFDGGTISRKKTELQLAYHRLALELAFQRRSKGKEDVIPEDVLRSCSPEPHRLLGNYRRAAYLFFAAGQKEKGFEMIKQAQAIDITDLKRPLSWEDWAFSRARELALLRRDADRGADFLAWVFQTLNTLGNHRYVQPVLGRFYADQAFIAHKDGRQKGQVTKFAWRAICNDLHWVSNKGLLLILAKSLWPL